MKFTAPMAMPTPKMIPGHGAFSAAFTKGEHEPTENDGHQGEPCGDGAGEGRLQNLYGVYPRG